jgi:hypothetical protein
MLWPCCLVTQSEFLPAVKLQLTEVVSDRLGGGRHGRQLGMLLEALLYLPAAVCYFLASPRVTADLSHIAKDTTVSVDPKAQCFLARGSCAAALSTQAPDVLPW